MSEKIVINSRLRNYSLEFVEDVFSLVNNEKKESSFYIIDSIIFKLYRKQCDTLIEHNRFLVVNATEPHKSYLYCGTVIEELLKKGIKRNSTLVAIGGGIIQDITAFISSVLFRGVDWSFIPTTLLAQTDSCIGGKTSINFGDIKNTIGNFNPPREIYIDLSFLDTLPADDIKSGIGEILHYLYYANSTFIGSLFDDYNDLLKNRQSLKKFITESLRIKKSVIEIDEFDKGERNKFNYGHTFGHALESVTNYSIKHGQAVTIGMDIANLISVQNGLMAETLYAQVRSKLSMNFPSYPLKEIKAVEYIKYLKMDKKNVDDQLVCILMKSYGELIKTKIPMDQSFLKLLEQYFRNN
ncbi:MAG: AroB-related putative sugar phosphate phospholyase (cyclizing) [Bacteroidota bacterium]